MKKKTSSKRDTFENPVSMIVGERLCKKYGNLSEDIYDEVDNNEKGEKGDPESRSSL